MLGERKGEEDAQVSRFLGALNAASDIELATQRLEAAEILTTSFGDARRAVQTQLIELADAELAGAVGVLTSNGLIDLEAVESISRARAELAVALGAPTAPERATRVAHSLELLQRASTRFGDNLELVLGNGDHMFRGWVNHR